MNYEAKYLKYYNKYQKLLKQLGRAAAEKSKPELETEKVTNEEEIPDIVLSEEMIYEEKIPDIFVSENVSLYQPVTQRKVTELVEKGPHLRNVEMLSDSFISSEHLKMIPDIELSEMKADYLYKPITQRKINESIEKGPRFVDVEILSDKDFEDQLKVVSDSIAHSPIGKTKDIIKKEPPLY